MDSTRLAASARLFSGSGVTARLRDGGAITVRPAILGDAGDISAMHLRCSQDSVYQRYHSVPTMTGRFLSGLVSTDVALVAEASNRSVVALANLARDADRSGELAILVEDAWQCRGLGTVLLDHLVGMARVVGFGEVLCLSLPGREWFRRALARLGPAVHERHSGHEATRLALRPAPTQLPAQLPAA